MDYALVLHIRDGLITEGRVLVTDQTTYDEFWS